MKKTLIQADLSRLPAELSEKVKASVWHDSSCSDTAKTYYLEHYEGEKNAYLKIIKCKEAPSLNRDVQILTWLKGKLPAAEVLYYAEESGYEYLLTTEIEGEDAIHPGFIEHPENMVRVLGESLRKLHDIDIKDCPIDTKVEEKLKEFQALVKEKQGEIGIWDDPVSYITKESLLKAAALLKSNPEDRVFTHGDYCLPNIILKENRLSGFIDLGNAGIGDRYFDLANALWSLNYNLKTRKWEKVFLKSYGLEEIDEVKMKCYLALDRLISD